MLSTRTHTFNNDKHRNYHNNNTISNTSRMMTQCLVHEDEQNDEQGDTQITADILDMAEIHRKWTVYDNSTKIPSKLRNALLRPGMQNVDMLRYELNQVANNI